MLNKILYFYFIYCYKFIYDTVNSIYFRMYLSVILFKEQINLFNKTIIIVLNSMPTFYMYANNENNYHYSRVTHIHTFRELARVNKKNKETKAETNNLS